MVTSFPKRSPPRLLNTTAPNVPDEPREPDELELSKLLNHLNDTDPQLALLCILQFNDAGKFTSPPLCETPAPNPRTGILALEPKPENVEQSIQQLDKIFAFDGIDTTEPRTNPIEVQLLLNIREREKYNLKRWVNKNKKR